MVFDRWGEQPVRRSVSRRGILASRILNSSLPQRSSNGERLFRHDNEAHPTFSTPILCRLVFTDRVRVVEKMPALDFVKFFAAADSFQQKVRMIAAHITRLGDVLNRDAVILCPLGNRAIPVELLHVFEFPRRIVSLHRVGAFFWILEIAALTGWHIEPPFCILRCCSPSPVCF